MGDENERPKQYNGYWEYIKNLATFLRQLNFETDGHVSSANSFFFVHIELRIVLA